MKNHLIKFSVILALGVARAAIADPLLVSVDIGSQSPATITPGSNVTYAVTVNRTNSGSMVINLSCYGLPAGTTASFSPNPVTFGNGLPNSKSATLTITTSASTPVGSYSFSVVAQDGGSHNSVTNTGSLSVGSDNKTVLPTHSITSIQVGSDGSATVAMHATPSKSYVLQATTALSPANWSNISTNTTDANGDCTMMDSGASAFSSRFYRTELLN